MSTAGPPDSQSQSFDAVALPTVSSPATPHPDGDGIDRVLVQQTKNEIRVLVQEVTQLSQSDIPLDQFYEEFLRRVVQALASHGGALWTVDANSRLQLRYQVNFPQSELVDDEESLDRHSRLIENVLASGQPTLVPPRSGSTSNEEAGNPSECLLVLAALKVEQETLGVIEIFQRAGGGPTTQRGYLRFLVQMSELASDYLTNRRLRHLGDRETLWENLEEFIRTIHRGLDVRRCCFTLVNEGRRLIRCDRVSVALRRGKRHTVTAVSGLDAIDRRADEIHRLGRLATVVSKARRPLWYSGPSREIPPQIEEPLQEYLDHSHATVVAVVPLYRPVEEGGDESQPLQHEPIATLIVEQLGDSRLHEGFQERVETVSQHSAIALANALDHQSLFLMPMWQTLGKAKWVVQARSLPKTVLVLVAIAAAISSLVFIPADFNLAADGKLQPSIRREIFAPVDGTVVEVPVRHEQFVQPGDLLVRLTNNELRVQIENLSGRQRTTHQRMQTVKRSQLHQRHISVAERNRLDGELLELEQVAIGMERELALLAQKEAQLTVRSEIAGQVVTWKLDELLMLRPVQIGQALMTVVDPAGDWELELHMPERRMGHLGRAVGAADELKVFFLLASHPDQELTGRLVEIHRAAEVRGEAGNTVLLRVAIDKEQLPELRSDTTVTARVHCGQRSIGYVVFHEVLETLQRKVMFWF